MHRTHSIEAAICWSAMGLMCFPGMFAYTGYQACGANPMNIAIIHPVTAHTNIIPSLLTGSFTLETMGSESMSWMKRSIPDVMNVKCMAIIAYLLSTAKVIMVGKNHIAIVNTK